MARITAAAAECGNNNRAAMLGGARNVRVCGGASRGGGGGGGGENGETLSAGPAACRSWRHRRRRKWHRAGEMFGMAAKVKIKVAYVVLSASRR